MSIKGKLASWFYRMLRPAMIYGYKDHRGNRLKKVRIGSSTFIYGNQNLDLEDDVYIGHHNFIEASNGISIATGCQITNNVTITTHSSHTSVRLYRENYFGNSDMVGYLTGSVSIGEYSFVGPYSTIMPGTKLGKGTLIKAYSYVKGEFPDFAILSGNPAKVVGDVRDLDQVFLDQHPELKESYEKWTR